MVYSPNQTPPRQCHNTFQKIKQKCSTTPRRRSGRKRSQSDTYRKVALTRSASKILKNKLSTSLSTPLRSKPFLLRILKESSKENTLMNNNTLTKNISTSSSNVNETQNPTKELLKKRASSIKLPLSSF
jgi:hypothetical protein